MCKRVLVTGASSNLGSAVVKVFYDHGFEVYGTSTKDYSSPMLKHVYKTDLSAPQISFPHLDSLDVLVNNAGVFTESEASDLSCEDWDKVFSLNVRGLMLTVRALLPLLRASDGSIVNISSMNAIHPGFGRTAHYDASKGAVSAYTRSLAAETGLRVNAVQPGLIARSNLYGSPLEEYWKSHSVRKAMMKSEEIAALVYFLSQSRGIYGQCITIDNGFTLC